MFTITHNTLASPQVEANSGSTKPTTQKILFSRPLKV